MSQLSIELKAQLTEQLSENPWSDELSDGWAVVEDGDWTDSHKSESKTDIVKHHGSGKFFRVGFYRTGDYWQGYETEFTDVVEVEPYEKVITAYREVKLLDVVVPAMSVAKAASHE
ncbi:hypothetical protein [Yersinia phage vB_YenP_AP10]|uniref:Uncharacterized protein n=1 Tax=Yersinia phage vB_YenP_AP10 TaxID=1735591 RepID=A0A0P0M6B9_9CAUD|nr:hypothetical protein AU149_gp26 [Yersinia phage vB_YenP_AP10]ALK86953.1 hypothetical protein [Yersinia phage vB_YenP_AP10]